MDKANTLYHQHHEQARRASRHLSGIFWLGVLLSAASYIVIARLLLMLLFPSGQLFTNASTSLSMVLNPWWIAIFLGLIPIIAMMIGYFDELKRLQKTPASALAMTMGATPLTLNGDFNQQRLRNVVEEMAVASGIAPPPILRMEKDDSINAFVLAGADKTVALTVSQGALTHLSREELQALIAHEFGHIINQDVYLYSKLSAMLCGYFIVSEWRYGQQEAISSSRFGFMRLDRDSLRIQLYYLLIGFWSAILLVCGRLLQASISREREWMADAKSVEYTRNSDALVNVLKKALALQTLQVNTFNSRESVAHCLFINYQPKTNVLLKQTHPPLRDRILRYGQVNEDEIAAIAHEIRERQRYSVLDNVSNNHQQAFAMASIYPIVFVQKRAQQAMTEVRTLSASEAQRFVVAAFIFHSGRQWFELTQSTRLSQSFLENVKPYIAVVGQLHPLAQFYYVKRHSQALHFTNSDDQEQFVQTIKYLITLDKDFTLYEWCYWLLVRQALQPSTRCDQHYKALQDALTRVFSFWVGMFSEEETKRQQLYQALITHTVPVPVSSYKPLEPSRSTYLTIAKDVQAIAQLTPMYQSQICAGLETVASTIKDQPLTSIYVTNTLISLWSNHEKRKS